MNNPAEAGEQNVKGLSFEQAQAELERIVERLEDQHTGLEEALALWERGEALHAFCQQKLDYAAARIEKLQVTQEEAAAATAEPDAFVPGAEAVGSPSGPAQQPPQQSPRQPQQSPPPTGGDPEPTGGEPKPTGGDPEVAPQAMF